MVDGVVVEVWVMEVGRGCRQWADGWVMVVLVGEGVATTDLVGLRFFV